MSSVLSDKRFHDEAVAYRFVEARIWPDGPICPHCGGIERIGKMDEKSTGADKCYQCRKPFTVKIGTIFESSHIPLLMLRPRDQEFFELLADVWGMPRLIPHREMADLAA